MTQTVDATFLRDLPDDQRGALFRIVTEWVGDGFLIPPYPDAYYDIFEALEIDGWQYDTRRPEDRVNE